MKYVLISFLCLLNLKIAAQNEYFEGTITYDLVYQDKTGEMTDEEAKQFMGNEQKYSIKGNKYISEMNGMLSVKQICAGNDTLYSMMGGINALMFIDTKENLDSLISYTITDTEETILGYDCKLLEIKSTEGLTRYYFSPKIVVNPEDYKNHEYGFWKFSLEVTGGALPLKSISDYEDLKLVTVAKSIELKALDDAIFIIPSDLPLIPSPEK